MIHQSLSASFPPIAGPASAAVLAVIGGLSAFLALPYFMAAAIIALTAAGYEFVWHRAHATASPWIHRLTLGAIPGLLQAILIRAYLDSRPALAAELSRVPSAIVAGILIVLSILVFLLVAAASQTILGYLDSVSAAR